MAVIEYFLSNGDKQLSEHFMLSEFKCVMNNGEVIDRVLVSEELIEKLELIHSHFNGATEIISGYRTPEHSVEVGGSSGDPHTQGKAADIRQYDSNRNIVLSPLVSCYAEDLNLNIGANCGGSSWSTHIDICDRFWRGDEGVSGCPNLTDSNGNRDVYAYFGITRENVVVEEQPIEQPHIDEEKRQFIRDCYSNYLTHEADESEINLWYQYSREEILSGISTSDEANMKIEQARISEENLRIEMENQRLAEENEKRNYVKQTYLNELGRGSSDEEVNLYMGMNNEEIFNAIYNSPEGENYRNAKEQKRLAEIEDKRNFIRNKYIEYLGRPSEEYEVDLWMDSSREDINSRIYSSDEAITFRNNQQAVVNEQNHILAETEKQRLIDAENERIRLIEEARIAEENRLQEIAIAEQKRIEEESKKTEEIRLAEIEKQRLDEIERLRIEAESEASKVVVESPTVETVPEDKVTDSIVEEVDTHTVDVEIPKIDVFVPTETIVDISKEESETVLTFWETLKKLIKYIVDSLKKS